MTILTRNKADYGYIMKSTYDLITVLKTDAK